MRGERSPGGLEFRAPVLDIRGVTKSYGEREVLRGIDLSVAEHGAVALIGASGSGKSTLLRCIDLLEEIDDGDVLLDGEVITDPSVRPDRVRKRLGIVFQGFNLFPHLTVLDNIVLAPVRAHGVPRAQAEARAHELLGRFGLDDRADARPERLSGGQQQRVAIVRALATQPRALLLDEITSALDPELVGEVLSLVRDLKADGMTMLLATHEMSFAAEVADEICFLHEGAIVERGTPERIFEAPEREETRRFLRRLLESKRL
ncbi:MAG: transporter related protein [Solirubrobacterales bacterium]|nr:transporter related protein [Solirubrobacterales bacterium]